MTEKFIPSSDEINKAESMMTPEQKELSKGKVEQINQRIGKVISDLTAEKQNVIDTAKFIDPSGESSIAYTENFDEAIKKLEAMLKENSEWLEK